MNTTPNSGRAYPPTQSWSVSTIAPSQVVLCVADEDVRQIRHRSAKFCVDVLEAGLGYVKRSLGEDRISLCIDPVNNDTSSGQFLPDKAIVCVRELLL